jgi:hypothetical protein
VQRAQGLLRRDYVPSVPGNGSSCMTSMDARGIAKWG